MGSSQSKSPSKEVSKDAERKKSTESVDDQDKMMMPLRLSQVKYKT